MSQWFNLKNFINTLNFNDGHFILKRMLFGERDNKRVVHLEYRFIDLRTDIFITVVEDEICTVRIGVLDFDSNSSNLRLIADKMDRLKMLYPDTYVGR